MNNRPILCAMGEALAQRRYDVTKIKDCFDEHFVYILQLFFSKLFKNEEKLDVLPLPDSIMFKRQNPRYAAVEGMACPYCFTVFDPTDINYTSKLSSHSCRAYGDSLKNRKTSQLPRLRFSTVHALHL